ncbi:MAG: hypothetical protein R3242_11610 [Akkermansiaceae bacterium]|nr:hypothetical protein [Akkermansiaceae bacterium]
MQRFLLMIGLVMTALCGSLSAQNNNQQQDDDNGVTDQQQRERFWEANLGGGQFMVALNKITSISRHQYILDGSLLVDEVTIDTDGQTPARFYFITPVTDEMRGSGIGAAAGRIADRGKQLVERAGEVGGTKVHEMVQKKFPQTTHAKQIEYRVLSSQILGQLYGSVRTAWRTGRGRVFTVR